MVGSKALRKSRKDIAVKKGLNNLARALGHTCHLVLTTTGCDRVVIGGGLVEELGEWLMKRILAALSEIPFAGAQYVPRVSRSSLGDDCVAVGAAYLGAHQ